MTPHKNINAPGLTVSEEDLKEDLKCFLLYLKLLSPGICLFWSGDNDLIKLGKGP